MIDGKARFDLESSHTADDPRLRRIGNPVDISEIYRDVMMDARTVDMVADLIGPAVKFHHCKINVKSPRSSQEVRWHQEHPFDPHANDDELVALLLLTDMTVENGALQIVPGAHRERYSLYQADVYTDESLARGPRDAVAEGHSHDWRGGQHLHHRHLDAPRLRLWRQHDRPRRLFIADYTAADAIPFAPPAVPSPLHGTIVRGKPTRFARLEESMLELPRPYTEDFFFSYQESADSAEQSPAHEPTKRPISAPGARTVAAAKRVERFDPGHKDYLRPSNHCMTVLPHGGACAGGGLWKCTTETPRSKPRPAREPNSA